MKNNALPLLFFILFSCIGYHQANAQIYIGLHGGVTLPQDFYADSRMSDNEWMFTQGHQRKAGAGRGWSAGIDVSYAMPFHTNLEAVFVGDYMQSGVSDDVQEYYKISYAHRFSQCPRYEMKLPRFRNIPLLLGVRYRFPLTKTIYLYGEALGGINLRFISPWSITYADANWPYIDRVDDMQYNNMKLYTYGNAHTYALRVGGGFMVKDLVTIGFGLNLFGPAPLTWDQEETVRYDIYGTVKENRTNNHIDYYDIKPVMINVSVGFRLKAFSGARQVQDW